jgi:hypothetical protein
MTNPRIHTSTRELRAEALRALVKLHAQDPRDLVELAVMLDEAADACAAINLLRSPPCVPCIVKRETACLLRAVARIRTANDRELETAR